MGPATITSGIISLASWVAPVAARDPKGRAHAEQFLNLAR